MNHLYF